MKRAVWLIAVVVFTGTVVVLSGCKCLDQESTQAGAPVIVAQPRDKQVAPGESASFKVSAKGEHLSYQWYFQNSDTIHQLPNAQTSTLLVSGNSPDRAGKYWCVVQSDGSLGLLQTPTYSASLTESSVSALSTNRTQGSFTSSSGSNTCCGTNCGFINFNNGGLGFSLTSGQTMTIQLSLSPTMSPLLDTSTWCARWRYGPQTNQTGCFTVISSTDERFTAPATAKYTVTVYIKNNCPPNGTLYYMTWN